MRTHNEDLLLTNAEPPVHNDIDLMADYASNPIWLGNIINFTIQLVFSGSPAGSFKLQGSCDEGRPSAVKNANMEAGVVNWTDIADSSQSVSAAGNHMWDVQNSGLNWVRVVWTATGGSGSPLLTSARCYVKGL